MKKDLLDKIKNYSKLVTRVVIIILMFSSELSYSQNNFGTRVDIKSGNYILGVATGDLNNDTYTDVLSPYAFNRAVYLNYNNSINVWEDNGNQYEYYLVSSSSSATEEYYDSDLADFDGDGDLDIVMVSRNTEKIVWYRNEGPFGLGIEPNFSGPFDILTSSGLGTVEDSVSYYFNGRDGGNWDNNMDDAIDGSILTFADDNNPDSDNHTILLNSNTWNNVYLGTISKVELRAYFKNNYDINPIKTIAPTLTPKYSGQQGTTHTYTPGDYHIAAWGSYFDITNDPNMPTWSYWWQVGDIDCILGAHRPDGGMVKVSKVEIKVTYTHYVGSTEAQTTVYAEDIDGDGDKDFITGTYEGTLEWFENDGVGNFTFHTVSTAYGGIQDVYVDDVDGDGKMDIALVTGLGALGWFRNDGNQNFTDYYIATIGESSRVKICDLDGDGYKDILFSSYSTYYAFGAGWIKNQNTGVPSTIYPASINPLPNSTSSRYLEAADFNADGDLDIVITSGDLSGSPFGILYYDNDGAGIFTVTDTINSPNNSLINNPYRVRAADIDNDGKLDVVVATDGELCWFPSKLPLLPIKLLSFTANKQENKIELNWQTATEINNNYFVIERSKDAIKFEEITRLPGAGNSNSLINYSALDEKPLSATNYYRLKQVDYDGKFTYSKIIAVNNSNNLQDITINQFGNKLNITNTTDNEYSINLIDIQGKSVYQKNNIIGLQNIDLSNLNKGIYLIKVFDNKNVITKKLSL